MDAELKAKWVKALRSGEYKQGRSTLKTRDGHFCCLGVACDLIDPTKWRPGIEGAHWYDDKGMNVWPNHIRELYGVDHGQTKTLWDMNDNGKSFSEIADYFSYSHWGLTELPLMKLPDWHVMALDIDDELVEPLVRCDAAITCKRAKLDGIVCADDQCDEADGLLPAT